MRTDRHLLHNPQKEFYGGCTTSACHQRQDARLRKFKQLQSFQLTSCELALHCFHIRDNINKYIMVPSIQCHSATGVKLTATEANLVQKWAPLLNSPFTTRLTPTKNFFYDTTFYVTFSCQQVRYAWYKTCSQALQTAVSQNEITSVPPTYFSR